jgi:hypothetical protein
MKESHNEGVAAHIGPESCVSTREGQTDSQLPRRRSVDRGTHRPGIEPRKKVLVEGADGVPSPESNMGAGDTGEPASAPPRSETPSMCGVTLHGNREASWSATSTDGDVARNVNPKGVRR